MVKKKKKKDFRLSTSYLRKGPKTCCNTLPETSRHLASESAGEMD